MTIDEILSLWETDSKISPTELGEEALKIASLHHKYFKIYTREKIILKKQESDFKKLKLDKYEFYSQGANEETPKTWRLPSKGLILKAEIPAYMEADKEIIDLSLKIGYQQEKVDLLESIIKSFQYRGYNIKSAIDWHKFTMGS
jgi:hypothetical protein